MGLTIKRRKGRTKQQLTPYGLLYQQCFIRLVFGRCLSQILAALLASL